MRVQVQGAPDSTMERALKRVRDKEVGACTSACIPIINNFPYLRLTIDQISALFQVYQIQLGNDIQDQVRIVEAI